MQKPLFKFAFLFALTSASAWGAENLVCASGCNGTEESVAVVGYRGASTTKRIQLKNIGPRRLRHISMRITDVAAFSFAGGSYPGLGGSCSDKLLPGEACDVVLALNASTSEKVASRLFISFRDRSEHDNRIVLLSLNGTIRPQLPSTVLLYYGFSDPESVTGFPADGVATEFFTPSIWKQKWADTIARFTVIEGLTSNADLVKTLRSQGKVFAHHVHFLVPTEGSAVAANNPCRQYLWTPLSAPQTAAQFKQLEDYNVCSWGVPFRNTLGGQLPGGFDAVMIDEFHSYVDGTALSNVQINALKRLRAQYPNKLIFVSGVAKIGLSGPTSPYGIMDNSLAAITDNADVYVQENYQSANHPRLTQFTSMAQTIVDRAPGLIHKTIYAVGTCQSSPVWVADPQDDAQSYWALCDNSISPDPAYIAALKRRKAKKISQAAYNAKIDARPNPVSDAQFRDLFEKEQAAVLNSQAQFGMRRGVAFWVFYRAKNKTIDMVNDFVYRKF